METAGFPWAEFALQVEQRERHDEVTLRTMEPLDLPVLQHKPTRAMFSFDNESTSDWLIEMRPGVEKPVQVLHLDSWLRVQGWLKEWIAILRREIGAMEWWRLVSDQPRLGIATDVPNIPFTAEEQETLQRRLEDIEERIIREAAVNEEHRQYVRQQFSEIKAMLRTTDKKTFRHAILGYAISVGSSIASNPEMVKSIVRMFSAAVAPHTGGVALLPDLTAT